MDRIQRLVQVAGKPERLALGLMSGMSMDGVDLALVRIRSRGEGRDVDLVRFESIPYEEPLSERLRRAVRARTREVCLLDFHLADRWAEEILRFLQAAGVSPAQVDFLASHGQTIDHVARERSGQAATLQVGDGDVLAERTGILTVSDFRPRDVTVGGEGAPLIPLADWLLYAKPGEVSACHNLGSIANVTVVTERREDVLAFDTGPANALIDGLARRTGVKGGIDRDGEVSGRGTTNEGILVVMYDAARPFLDRPPPKSAGFEDFGATLADWVLASRSSSKPETLLRTAVEFTARTIAEAYKRWVLPKHPTLKLVRFSGGGTRNPTLMKRIAETLQPLGLTAEALDPTFSKAKEAIGFALLGDETLAGRPGNLPSATGARRPVVLGKISL